MLSRSQVQQSPMTYIYKEYMNQLTCVVIIALILSDGRRRYPSAIDIQPFSNPCRCPHSSASTYPPPEFWEQTLMIKPPTKLRYWIERIRRFPRPRHKIRRRFFRLRRNIWCLRCGATNHRKQPHCLACAPPHPHCSSISLIFPANKIQPRKKKTNAKKSQTESAEKRT